MSILDEVLEYAEYGQRYHNYLSITCPFHDDNRPSLIVHEDYYNCLACSAKGRTEALLTKLKGEPAKPNTKEHFSNPFTKWLKNQTLVQALKTAWQTMNEHPSSYMRDKRGITEKTCKDLGIGMRDGWITFPIRDNYKKIIGAAARADETNLTDAKYVTPSGQDGNMLYVPSWELIDKAKDIYCVFGIIDAVTLCQVGIASFSTTGGKKVDPKALDIFRKRIIFLPDKGEESAAMNIAKYMGWRGKMAKCNWPDDSKDVNDIWIKHPQLFRASFGV